MACLLSGILEPSDATARWRVKGRHIGLDVQKRRPIQYVHAHYVKNRTFNFVEADDRDPDWIGPLWRARRKNTMGLVIQKWDNLQFAPKAAIQEVNKDDVRETVQIFEALRELGQNLDQAFDSFRAWRLNGHILKLGERATDETDGTHFHGFGLAP